MSSATDFMLKRKFMERRTAQRLNIRVPIRYSFHPNKRSISSPITADNISGTGLGVTLKKPAEKGAKLKVLIYFSDDQRPIASTGRVMWCKKITKKEGNLFKIGMRHVRIDTKDKNRFVFLFCETMLNHFMASSGKRVF